MMGERCGETENRQRKGGGGQWEEIEETKTEFHLFYTCPPTATYKTKREMMGERVKDEKKGEK